MGSRRRRPEDLFARIGVAEGLRLRPVDEMQFWMQYRDYELPQTAPAGVESAAWEEWRTAVRLEAEPKHLGWFEYSLEDLFHLPELYGCGDLSQRGQRAFSRLVVHSMRGWPDGWEKATLRKVRGESSTWRITSPLKHWLSSMAWLSDGGTGERPLPDRWFVPTSLLRGQGERFRHLRPLSLDLSRRLDDDPELVTRLKGLGLNVYPTDGEKIGPELLDALAEAWRSQRVPPGRFDIFLGQLRHAWQHLDESNGLPGVFLVRTARRGFKVLDGDSLGDAYLPNDDEKGRSLREEKKHVLEMELREANRLARVLVETTAVRLASELVERALIDGAEWTGGSDAVRALEETRYRWLPAVLLAIQAHGGPNPTGHTTAGWADALTRLRGAGVVECKSIEIELVASGETIAKSEPVARWLKGDVLAVTSETGAAYEALAPAAQAMLDRQDLLKDLRLVLGALDGFEAPSLEQLEGALDRAEIDVQAFADIRSRWAGNTGLVASRIRPVAALLGVAGEEFEAAALSTDALTDWLADNVPQWEALELLPAARRSRDDHTMGLAAWHALGDVAQLPEWNAVLNRLGDEYEAVRNKLAHEQTAAHLEAMQALLPALAREIAVDCDEPQLFRKIEDATRAFVEPDDWSQRWWEVPFVAVVDALFEKYRGIVDAGHFETLRGVTSASQLRVALEERGVEIDLDPYETARVNSDRFNKVLLDVHDLYRTWLEIHAPESEVPDRPTAPELGGDAYLRRWSDGELWHRALAILDDRKFTAACGELSDPQTVSERLGIDKEAIDVKRRERAEQEREAARKPKTVEIAGESFEMETINYAELLRQHTATLAHPSGPRVGEGEFTPLGPLAKHGGSGGGGEKEGKSAHRRLSPEEAQVIGIVGEMHAYRYLRKEFGGRAVRSAAWVSESRLKVLPPVEGETVEVSDGHGFDFRFNYDGIRWHLEVKATKGEETSFDLGISEIEAATRIARRRGKTWRWGILRVRNALSADPGIDWLPNPFEEGFRKH